MRFNQTVRTGLTYMAGGAAVVACILFSLPRTAGAQADARMCTNALLRGAYGLAVSGVRAVPPPFGPTETFAAIGSRTYDGNGGYVQTGDAIHGQLTGVTLDPGGVTGTYVVNPDCTGRSTLIVPGLPFVIEHGFVIIDNGREIREVVLSPHPNVAVVELRRQ